MDMYLLRGTVSGIVTGYDKGNCSAEQALNLIRGYLIESYADSKDESALQDSRNYYQKCIDELVKP